MHCDVATFMTSNCEQTLISGSNIGYAEVENTLAGAEKLIRHTVSE